MWSEIVAINRDVNRSVVETSDQRQYGLEDYWAIPASVSGRPMRGDCEDYALLKRERLIATGVPEGALTIAIGRTPWGVRHAVLLVATASGEYVLDSLSDRVQHWSEAELVWETRQAPGNLLSWIDISGV